MMRAPESCVDCLQILLNQRCCASHKSKKSQTRKKAASYLQNRFCLPDLSIYCIAQRPKILQNEVRFIANFVSCMSFVEKINVS